MTWVRRALPADCGVAAALITELMASEGHPVDDNTEIALCSEMQQELLTGRGAVFLAVQGNEEGTHCAVGVIRLRYLDDAIHGLRVEASGLYVVPWRRNRGIGWRLLTEAARQCPLTDAVITITTNRWPSRAYARLGFAPVLLVSNARLSDVRAALKGVRDGVSVAARDRGGSGPVRGDLGQQEPEAGG